MIRGDLFFTLDFDADVQLYGAGNSRLVGSFFKIIPDIHLAAESSHFDYSLAEEVVGLSGELLAKFRLKIVVFVPNSNLDSI